MPAMRRWRAFDTGIVHGFSPLRVYKVPLMMFCGERMRLRTRGSLSDWYWYTDVPTRRNLTPELPSVKTPLTCLGCIANNP